MSDPHAASGPPPRPTFTADQTASFEVAYREAKGGIEGQLTTLKELRDRGVTITSVASGIATLTVTALVALRDRSGATLDDGLSVPALVVTILSLLLVMVASAVLWAPLAYGTRVDGRGVADWVERHSFSAAEVYLEVAVQLEVAGDRNRVGLRFRHDWFRVGLFALAIEVFSAGLLIWSFTS